MTRQDQFELAWEAKTGTPVDKIKAKRCHYGVYITSELREAFYWYQTGWWKGFAHCEKLALEGAYDTTLVRQDQTTENVVLDV